MSGITFLSENLIKNAEIELTSGTENAQFPLANIQVDSPSIKFRSLETTCVIQIDLLTTRSLDFIAVAADPLESFQVNSITARTSTTTDFTSSPVYTLDLSTVQTIGFVNFTQVSHRYVEITLNSSGDFTELGSIFIGKGLNIPLNSLSISSFKYGYDDRSSVRQNKYGQKFIDQTNLTKILSGDIEFCTKEEQELIDDMLIEHGKTLPLWVIVDSNEDAMNEGNFKLTIYGYLDNDISWSAAGGQLYSTSVDVKQAI